MEKFTKWADKGTHINPFLPPCPTGASKGLGPKIISFLFGTIVCLIRLPFFLLALALVLVTTFATNPFTSIILGAGLLGYSIQLKPGLETAAGTILGMGLAMLVIKPIHRLLSLLLVRPSIRFLLSVLGVSFIEQHANVRKLGLRPPGSKQPSGRIGATIKGGDLLISNHTSALEVLYFASRLLPIFTRFSVGDTEVDFGVISLLGAFWRASHVPSKTIPESNDLASIIYQGVSEQRPVVLFPEVVRSNGDGILNFAKGTFEKLATNTSLNQVRTHVFTFSGLKGTSPLTSHTVGLALGFIIRIASKWSTPVYVTYVSNEDIPDFPLKNAGSGGGVKSALLRKSPAVWMEDVRTLMSQMIGTPKLNLGYDDFVTFGQYYKAIARGDTTTAATFAGNRDKI